MPAPYDRSDYHPLGVFNFEALTVAGTAVAFTADTRLTAILASVRVEGAQIRYRTDGENPTASVGTIVDDGDSFNVWGSSDINSIRFIRTGGVSATLNTEFSK